MEPREERSALLSVDNHQRAAADKQRETAAGSDSLGKPRASRPLRADPAGEGVFIPHVAATGEAAFLPSTAGMWRTPAILHRQRRASWKERKRAKLKTDQLKRK